MRSDARPWELQASLLVLLNDVVGAPQSALAGLSRILSTDELKRW